MLFVHWLFNNNTNNYNYFKLNELNIIMDCSQVRAVKEETLSYFKICQHSYGGNE